MSSLLLIGKTTLASSVWGTMKGGRQVISPELLLSPGQEGMVAWPGAGAEGKWRGQADFRVIWCFLVEGMC